MEETMREPLPACCGNCYAGTHVTVEGGIPAVQCRYNPPQILVIVNVGHLGQAHQEFVVMNPQVPPNAWCAQHGYDPEADARLKKLLAGTADTSQIIAPLEIVRESKGRFDA